MKHDPTSGLADKLDEARADAARWKAEAEQAREALTWRDIATAPTDRRNFLVRAYFADTNYRTDPWVVFRDPDGTFMRWPHDRPPTEWCPVPDAVLTPETPHAGT